MVEKTKIPITMSKAARKITKCSAMVRSNGDQGEPPQERINMATLPNS